MVLFTSCKKEAKTEKEEVVKVETNTIFKSCKYLAILSYDNSGNENGKTVWYYSNNRVDSVVGYNPNPVWVTRIEYQNNNTRKNIQYTYPSGKKNPGYSIDIINSAGDVIESKSYDDAGKMITWNKYTYKCD